MSEILVNTIKKADGTGGLTIPTGTGTVATLAGGTYTGNIVLGSNSLFIGGTGSANELSDYEEGTFTPTFTSSGGTLSVGYSSQVGLYTKIGQTVHVTVDIQSSGAQSGGTGDVLVSGFPFNFKSTPQLHAGSVGFSNNWSSDRAPSHISGNASTNSASLRRFVTLSEVNTGVLATDVITSSRVYFQITYETN